MAGNDVPRYLIGKVSKTVDYRGFNPNPNPNFILSVYSDIPRTATRSCGGDFT